MTETTGVILLNMGGPETLDDVESFLYQLFSDRSLITLGPSALQRPIAWFISRRRAPKSRAAYQKIGGGSPLLRITQEQGQALEKELANHGDFCVTIAMRYCSPTADEGLGYLLSKNVKRVIALPLYPQYSRATSGSSLDDLHRAITCRKISLSLEEIHGWPDHHLYISCLAENIRHALQHFADKDAEIVYSAHSLPTSFIHDGDPYLDQVHSTIKAVEKHTGKKGHLCFQSRSGPVEWLSPSTGEMLTELASQGCKNIVMVPISFVSDHLETLYEINILYNNMARDLGMECHPCASLNTSPSFIRALADLVLQKA